MGINAILPFITNEVYTIETQYHCMTIIKNTIRKVNPSQTPIDVCDQPVYAISKAIQIRINHFGHGKYLFCTIWCFSY